MPSPAVEQPGDPATDDAADDAQGFTHLADRKKEAAAAFYLAIASLGSVGIMMAVWLLRSKASANLATAQGAGSQNADRIDKLYDRVLQLDAARCLVQLVAAILLCVFAGITINARNKKPNTSVGQPDIMRGTGIAAMSVGVVCVIVQAVACTMLAGPGVGEKEAQAATYFCGSGSAIAVMAAIAVGAASTHDNWTWDGARLVSKDTWDDCDAYEEDHCMTMDQWDAVRRGY